MENEILHYVLVGGAAFVFALLTLFSGFGLNTLLMPVMAIFFDIAVAIAITAIVHLLNNVFKVILVGKDANWRVVWTFGIPAILAAIIGTVVLLLLRDLPLVYEGTLFGLPIQMSPINLTIGILILFFVVLELLPRFQQWRMPTHLLPLGGALSGFFGGLSGHQGAFRSAFLLATGLNTQAFIATSVMLAILVDAIRLPFYFISFAASDSRAETVNIFASHWLLIVVAVLASFLGSWLATRMMKRITMGFVRIVVAVLLFVIGLGLITGLIRGGAMLG